MNPITYKITQQTLVDLTSPTNDVNLLTETVVLDTAQRLLVTIGETNALAAVGVVISGKNSAEEDAEETVSFGINSEVLTLYTTLYFKEISSITIDVSTDLEVEASVTYGGQTKPFKFNDRQSPADLNCYARRISGHDLLQFQFQASDIQEQYTLDDSAWLSVQDMYPSVQENAVVYFGETSSGRLRTVATAVRATSYSTENTADAEWELAFIQGQNG